jgi:DNA polymerase
VIPRVIYDTETRSHCEISRGLDVYSSHATTQPVCAAVATATFSCAATFLPSTEGRDALESKMRAAGMNVVPPETLVAIVRASRVIVAHNFAFDQVITQRLLGVHIPTDRWSCTMSRAMRVGLPGGLGNLADVLGLGEEGGKDAAGNRLMKQVMKPRPTWTKKQTGPEWFEDADRLSRVALYCQRDVAATLRIDKMLPELEPAEREIWQHVHAMNLRGIPVDVQMIDGAIRISEEAIRDVTDRIRHYTLGMIQSLKAPGQLVAWASRYGVDFPSWAKDEVTAALADPKLPEPVRVVALARQEAGRGSVAKYETAQEMVSPDGRLRHQLVYAGTSTLRLAGRGVQPLNLPRPKIEADKSAGLADIKAGRPIRVPEWKLRYDPETALAAIRRGDLAALRDIGDPEEILSENIRPMIVAPPGKKIVSPDLSAIEARGVFWISDCAAALEGYRQGIDLYCQLASTIVGFPVKKKDNPEERQLGKVGILQCGYGSGASKVALTNKIDEEVAQRIVYAYRGDYSEVPRTWRDLENSAIEAIRNPGYTISCCRDRVSFVYEAGWLRMLRPSGTWMYMPDAGVDYEGRLFYHSWIKGGWREESIWGGVLINFVVQGMCRELMYGAEMQLAQDSRYELFLQCYDSLSSLVNEADADALCDNMIRVMTTPPHWAPDFPLAAEGKPKERYS